MEEKFFSRQNINFLLFEMHKVQDLSEYEYFVEYDKGTLDLALGTASRVAVEIMRPCLREMDANPPEFREGTVYVHPSVKEFLTKCGEIGLISAAFPFIEGGHQVPYSAVAACNFIMAGANPSLSVYCALTAGAAGLISAYGSPELKKYFLPKMFSGQWQGTMALTEPGAGSSLSDIKTKAVPTGKGLYQIRGSKVFISAGTHNGVDNIVHLMLARIEGAPAGTEGISLFAVPMLRGDGRGGLVFNDVTCIGIEHTLGYRGVPAAQLSMGESNDCSGWLVGEENNGLDYMSRMMNEERLNTGIAAAGIASAAYYDSLEYSVLREQGRPVAGVNYDEPQCAIINHPDVKRMLLSQKAVVEGSLSLSLQIAKYIDLKKVSSQVESEKYKLLLEFLTPVVKSYASEKAVLSVSSGMQIFGGYGYCDDFNLELFSRDSKLHPVFHGTTGILGRDLLTGIFLKNGRPFELFIDEVNAVIKEAEEIAELNKYAEILNQSVLNFRKTTEHLFMIASRGDMGIFLADATLYQQMTGILAVAWQWLMQAICAVRQNRKSGNAFFKYFYSSKIHTMKYFFRYELPEADAISGILTDDDILTAGADPVIFRD